MGREWDPDRFIGDPLDPAYKVHGLQLTDVPPMRLQKRETLLKQKVLEMELFDEEICEVLEQEQRYILRRNPVRHRRHFEWR